MILLQVFGLTQGQIPMNADDYEKILTERYDAPVIGVLKLDFDNFCEIVLFILGGVSWNSNGSFQHTIT